MTEVPLHARICPDWRGGNPYQQLLADSVERSGGRVSFASDYRRGLPFWRDWRACDPRPDVLHLHWLSNHVRFEDYPRKWLYARKLAFDLGLVRRAGGGVVWTVHNAISHEARFPALETSLHRRVARRADRVIVHSESALAEVGHSHGLDPAKTRVIPHGHYRSVYPGPVERAEARRALGLESARRVYLFLGLLRPYKGLEELFAAWRAVQDKPEMAETWLVIAGKAIDPDYGQKIGAAATGLKRVRADVGFVPENRLPVYFGAADAVVLPFQRILTSGSLLLAMSYGVPVVAPHLPLVTEVLGDAARFAYPPDTGGALAEALREVAEADLTSVRAATVRRTDAFGWDAIGRRTLEVYEEAAAAGRKRRRSAATRSAPAKPRRR